jgi:hypothetical protein
MVAGKRWMEKIMSKTANASQCRELQDSELDGVMGGESFKIFFYDPATARPGVGGGGSGGGGGGDAGAAIGAWNKLLGQYGLT